MTITRLPGMKAATLTVASILLAGCVGTELDVAKSLTPNGPDFSKSLYAEYIMLSTAEFNEGDYEDADTFATRAIDAAAGVPADIEALDARMIPLVHKGALATARRELSEVFAATSTTKDPVNSAKAQAAFECWMQEQEENIQPEDVEKCKADFAAAMAAIRLAMAPSDPPAPAAVDLSYTVFFGFDSDVVDAAALEEIVKAVKAYDAVSGSRVSVGGYTDRAGNPDYNVALAERRARNVAEAMNDLAKNALSGKIDISVFGEQNNAVPTPDGKQEQGNRRVKIDIVK